MRQRTPRRRRRRPRRLRERRGLALGDTAVSEAGATHAEPHICAHPAVHPTLIWRGRASTPLPMLAAPMPLVRRACASRAPPCATRCADRAPSCAHAPRRRAHPPLCDHTDHEQRYGISAWQYLCSLPGARARTSVPPNSGSSPPAAPNRICCRPASAAGAACIWPRGPARRAPKPAASLAVAARVGLGRGRRFSPALSSCCL